MSNGSIHQAQRSGSGACGLIKRNWAPSPNHFAPDIRMRRNARWLLRPTLATFFCPHKRKWLAAGLPPANHHREE